MSLPIDASVRRVVCRGRRQYAERMKLPNDYCPNHPTGVRLPDGFVVPPLQYVD
jgi:hypothetical protein